MKKNYFVVLVMVIVMICSSMSFATVFDNTNQAEVVMPTTEPAEHTSNGIISSQFNYDEYVQQIGFDNLKKSVESEKILIEAAKKCKVVEEKEEE